MPIYTYRCENCGVQFERSQKFTDAPLTRCPECNKKTLRKVYTPVGIVFKGSGFYSTDNRSPSGQTSVKQAAAAEKADKAEKAEKTEKPAEPKVESAKPASSESSSTSSPSKVEPVK